MSDKLIGLVIDERYKLVEQLDSGGFGTVYRAIDLRLDERSGHEIRPHEVAVKILAEEKIAKVNLERFREYFVQEAQLAITLSQHANIVTVTDYGIDRDTGHDIYYIVMQLLTGGTLREWIKDNYDDRPLEPEKATEILQKIAEAIDYAHSQGVIHRDIKTSNIMFDAADHVYVVDFGIAKILGEHREAEQSSIIVGTPANMAPEQRQGENVSAQTDIWAFGFITHELLAGVRPRSVDETTTIATGPLSSEIQRVLNKALKANPKKRYKTASALVDALKDAINNQSKIPDWKIGLWIATAIIFAVVTLIVGILFSDIILPGEPTATATATAIDEPTATATDAPTATAIYESWQLISVFWPQPEEQEQIFNLVFMPADCFTMANNIRQCVEENQFVFPEGITNAEYFVCFNEGICNRPAGEIFDPTGADKNQPVVNITSIDALRYCEWLGGHLITEREWEYISLQLYAINVAEWTATRFGDEFDYQSYDMNDGREDMNNLNQIDQLVIRQNESPRYGQDTALLDSNIGFRCVLPLDYP